MSDDNLVIVEDREPWDKRDSESGDEYELFWLYLEMGAGRKVVDMQRVYPDRVPDIVALNKLSSRNDWRARAIAFDNHELVVRQNKYTERLDGIMENEFSELEDALRTSHDLRLRIQGDTRSSTYSLLNAWKNWVDAHGKITDELHKIAGKPSELKPVPELKAFEHVETKKTSEKDKIEEVTRALRMISNNQ